ncbi:MAG TPA: DUF952 domain-containing protein [Acidimicrobiales bacterium]|nr:DUF952 domain-containing protein [Acidimicrobiales bacterium]
MEPIFHITDQAQWYAAAAMGVYTGSTRGKSLDEVGFIHCSFAHQVQPTGVLVYSDVSEPLVVVTIDPALVSAEIKVENDFPHIYGPLHLDAVIEVQPFHA